MANLTLSANPFRHLRTGVWACAVLALLCGVAHNAVAVTVHTWLDSDGVRHFADSAPPEAESDASLIEFEDAPVPAADSTGDYYSIANQWARLREERDIDRAQALDRERLRNEQRDRRAVAEDSGNDADRRTNYPLYGRGYGQGYGQGYGESGYPPRGGYGNGAGSSGDRDAYLKDKRRHGFAPLNKPKWPRER
jgi:hypothetical protein